MFTVMRRGLASSALESTHLGKHWNVPRHFYRITRQWGGSSVGRASRSQCEGREFDPPPLHQMFLKALSHKAFFFCARCRHRSGPSKWSKRSPTCIFPTTSIEAATASGTTAGFCPAHCVCAARTCRKRLSARPERPIPVRAFRVSRRYKPETAALRFWQCAHIDSHRPC